MSFFVPPNPDVKPNPRIQLLSTLIKISGKLQSSASKRLKTFGISFPQYQVMEVLMSLHPRPLTVLEIQEHMVDRMSNVSRLADKMQKSEIIYRNVAASDRRKVEIGLTEKGIELLFKIRSEPKLAVAHTEFLSNDDVSILQGLLERMTD